MRFDDILPAFEQALKQLVKDEVARLIIEPPQKTKLFYNLKELVEITGITYLGLKGRIKRGTLRASKCANTWLVSEDEVNRLIDKLEQQNRA